VFVRWDDLSAKEAQRKQLPGFSQLGSARTFDAPEALDTRFYEIHARSALNRVPQRSQVPFRWTINPYRGCAHACVYCFARPTHTYLDLNAREDFEREIVVKVNVPELLRTELARSSWKREHVALGTNTDPYQWVESRYLLLPGIWQALADYRTPCSVLTKSPLLLRDIDLFKQLARNDLFFANLSIPTLDERAWRATEPRTPNPNARLEAVSALNEAGIPTGVLIAPLMPGINDDPKQVERIVSRAAEAGATSVNGVALHLRGEVREIFFDWLRASRPDLLSTYEKLYGRGAYAPPELRKHLAGLASLNSKPAHQPRGHTSTDRDTDAIPRQENGSQQPQQQLF
jgi:DNA repair photolyase